MNEATRRLNPELFPPEQTPRPDPAVDALLAGKPMRTNHRNDGRGFQKEIETTCGAYQSRRAATIRKVDPPTRLVGGGNARRVIFLANPFLDFSGVWTARHGRALYFEAKSTATHRLKLGSGGISETQIAALRMWRLGGAAAFVLWQWSAKVSLLLPELVCGAADRGEKSIAFDSGLAVPRGEGSVLWDFLPVLERALFDRDCSTTNNRSDLVGPAFTDCQKKAIGTA